jgi:uracil-DNA glycosylase family 4
MSQHLDPRQRAMLAEMGVRVWQPEPAAEELDDALPSLGVPAAMMASPVAAARPATSNAPAQIVSTLPLGEIAGLDWAALEATVASCQACGLCQSRKNTVFGVGHTQARWMIVGEAPGENEDLQGEPFVGAAGQLLDNMLQALGLRRDAGDGEREQAVYIANVLKCRPPGNRNPQPEEVLRCEPYLRRQVALLQPQVIVAMGRFAAQSLLQASVPDVATMPLGKLRGQVYDYEGVPVIVSYHPAYLLRTPQDKAKAWADLCLALRVQNAASTH